VSHCTSDLLDVVRLVRACHWNTGDTWKIHQGEVRTSVRINRQNNWFVNDVLTFTTNLVCKEIDSLLYLCKIGELFVWHLLKLGPWSNVLRCMVKSELQWSPSNDTITSWQKVKTNNRLEYTRFTSGLSSQHCNSWQLDILLETHISQFILN